MSISVSQTTKTDGEFAKYLLQTVNDGWNFFSWIIRQRRNIFFSWITVHLPEIARQKHTYIVAGTGSGKSELLKSIIADYLTRDYCSQIILDPNGDFALQVAQLRENTHRSRKGKLVYIDPYFTNETTPIINPFDLKDKSEQNIDITTQFLAKNLQEIFSEDNASLSLQMQTILSPCIATVLRMDNGTIWDLQRMMNDDTNAVYREIGKQSPNLGHRTFFQEKFMDKSYIETKKSVYTRIQKYLNSPTFAHLMSGKSTFDLERAMEEKCLIVFNLSKGKMGPDISKCYGRLIISMIQAIALKRAHQEERKRTHCHLIIDEFQNYIVDSIGEIFAESRKYRVYLSIVTQVVGQNMSKGLKDIIMGNTEIKIIGVNNYQSRLEMSKEMHSEMETMRELKRGKFMVKVGTAGAPFKLSGSTRRLGNKGAMSALSLIHISEPTRPY